MTYEIIAAPRFKKDAKALAKKYPSIKDDLRNLFLVLETDPAIGAALGNNC